MRSDAFRARLSGSPPRPCNTARLHHDGPERIAQIVSDDCEHLVAGGDGSFGRAVQACVVEGERGAAGELLRELQIVRAVLPVGRG